MQFDLIIPTRGTPKTLQTILDCISDQSFLPYRITLVINAKGSQEDFEDAIKPIIPEDIKDIVQLVFTEPDFVGNASHARNLGLDHATSPYVYFVDDDNQFSEHFFASCIAEYTILRGTFGSDILYSPTIIWRTTKIIQSQGLKAFHFICGRPEPVKFSGWKSKIIKALRFASPLPSFYYSNSQNTRAAMIGGNSLLSAKSMFEMYPFDEDMGFVYEDIDASYRMTKDGVPLIVSHKAQINHMERNKTTLEHSFLAYPESAYKKAKNRIIFVKKNGVKSEKILFFFIGLPITSIMSFIFILAKGGISRWNLAKAYWKGICDGLKYKIA